ncbi:MAG: acyl-CoA thioesterase [Sphingobacteriales bacterium]|nr:acyl-CoA thioesterase [Sphingobacteriales bacterium]
MISHEIEIRITYADTDMMGFVYYGNYPVFYEKGRTELIRSLGLSYREMEEKGILMPVRNMKCEYYQPARYDDIIRVKTTVHEMPSSRMSFHYEIFNQKGELIHEAFTDLIFLNAQSRKPVRAPAFLKEKIRKHFEKD